MDFQRLSSILISSAQARSHPNSEVAARPHATWKYKHMLRKVVCTWGKDSRRRILRILKMQILPRQGVHLQHNHLAVLAKNGVGHHHLIYLIYHHHLSDHLSILPSYGKARKAKDRDPFLQRFQR